MEGPNTLTWIIIFQGIISAAILSLFSTSSRRTKQQMYLPRLYSCSLWSDDSQESSSHTEERHLPSPIPRRTGFDEGKVVKRRAVKRWTPEAEQTLREAVAKYGQGNWKLILNYYSEIFQERTEVDLKDKWRNMCRQML